MVKEALSCKSHRSVTASSENSPKRGCCGEQTANLLPGGEVGPLAPAAEGHAHVRGSRYQPLTFPCWDKGEPWGWDMTGWAQNHSLGLFFSAPSSVVSFLVTLADHLVSVISTSSTMSPGLHDCHGAYLSLEICRSCVQQPSDRRLER